MKMKNKAGSERTTYNCMCQDLYPFTKTTEKWTAIHKESLKFYCAYILSDPAL